MIGLLTYLPTLAHIPHVSYVVIIFYLLFKYGKNLNFGKLSNFLIILLIITLSIANNLAHTNLVEKPTDYIPFLLLMIITLLASNHFTKKDSKILIYLITFESLVVILEASLGVSTIFTSLPNYREVGQSSLLYQNRPLGLSLNSSAIALKIFVAFLLITYHKFHGKLITFSVIVLSIACVLTFNRTVIITLILFYALYYTFYIKELKFKKPYIAILGISLVLISLVLIFYSNEISETILAQFSRNKGKIELSGRDKIWKLFTDFIQQNFQIGNGSFKYKVFPNNTDHSAHGHNSFLQVLATHGFYIFLLYIALIIKNLNKNNFIFVFGFILFSMAQYGVFWGISLMDIVFFKILFDTNLNPKQQIIKQ